MVVALAVWAPESAVVEYVAANALGASGTLTGSAVASEICPYPLAVIGTTAT